MVRDYSAQVVQFCSALDTQRGDTVNFDGLSPQERRDVEALYWSSKEMLNSFDTRIQSYGCSVCGELYRARDGVY